MALRVRWRRSMAMVVCGVGVLLGTASPALAQWPAGDYRCFRIGDGTAGYGMWKSQDAQSYSPTYVNHIVGNLNRFVVIPIEPNVVKIMDWQGYFLTSNGDLIYPTRDWRGHASSWRYEEFLRGKLRNIQYERYARNDGGILYLRALTEAFGHDLRTYYLGQQEGNCLAQFGLGTAAAEIRATAGSPTPLVRLFETGGVVPGWFEINWGDDTPVIHGNGLAASPFTDTPIVPNANTCAFNLRQCIITDRHVYQSSGDYTITVIVGTEESPARRGLTVTIPAHIEPAVTTYNILAIGDSASSGEGVPTWPYSMAGNGVIDFPVWERRFDPGSDNNETSAARKSYYSGPSLAAEALQAELPALNVNFWHKAFSGATITDSPRTITGQATTAGPGPYDAVLVNAGANDMHLGTRITECTAIPLIDCLFFQSDWIAADLAQMDDKFDALRDAIRDNTATENAHVFINGVFDFTGGVSPYWCGTPLFTPDEVSWIRRSILLPLDGVIRQKAIDFGWTYVPADFTEHGICGQNGFYNPDRWVHTDFDSLNIQGDLGGIYHPNYFGHQEIARQFLSQIRPFAQAKLDRASDVTAPTVTAPASIVVAAISSDGTPFNNPTLPDSVAVANFLNGGSAVDTVDASPVRLYPIRVDCGSPSIFFSGDDITFVFPVGVTCVRFSYRDASNNIGTAVASVTVTPPVGGVVTGAGIPVTATDSSNAPQPVTLTFLGSAAAGLLQANPMVPPPAVPAGFQIVGTAYNITSTVVFTGNVQVCLAGAFVTGDVIYHNGVPVVPTTVSGGSACGVVSSLSPFMVVRPTSTNTKLVAHAGDDQVVEAHGPKGARVKLNGSSTPAVSGKHKRLDFRWTEGTTLLGSEATARATLSIGRHVLTLSVTNNKGLTASDTVEVVVRDTTAPRLKLFDGAVRAIATSPAGAPVLFHWRAIDRVDGELPVTCSPASGEVFPIGRATVTCHASDSNGNGATGSFTVKVRPLLTP